ncbi:MAG: hypothetical protein ACQES0_06940 [Bacteroidota bacterium]
MKKNVILLGIIAMIFLLSSCTARLVDFTVISTKALDLTGGKAYVKGNERVEGVDKIHLILGFPTGTVNLKEAIDMAIESTPGCVALMDGVVSSKAWFAVFYGQSMYIVEGTPLIDPSSASIDSMPEYMALNMDKDGNITKEELNKEEFELRKSEIMD